MKVIFAVETIGGEIENEKNVINFMYTKKVRIFLVYGIQSGTKLENFSLVNQ